MKRVLVPIDASAHCLQALRATLREGAGAIERIELLNVQPRLHRHISRWVSRADRDGWRAQRAQAALAPARRMLEGSGISWGAHTATGPVGAAIASAARELRCDEIVLGAARRGALGRLLANSVTAQLLESSTVPVRVVPGPAAPRYERLALPAGLGLIALLILADE
jgi:nucleotide-binding universal stress UspA family protein